MHEGVSFAKRVTDDGERGLHGKRDELWIEGFMWEEKWMMEREARVGRDSADGERGSREKRDGRIREQGEQERHVCMRRGTVEPESDERVKRETPVWKEYQFYPKIFLSSIFQCVDER